MAEPEAAVGVGMSAVAEADSGRVNDQEDDMKTRLILAGLLCVSFAGTAMADEYYVVQNPTTHHCTVVTEKPEAKTVVTQVGPLAFATRDEAEDRIKQTKVCTDTTTGSGGTVVHEKEIDKD
jgi:hypothetical protein